VRRNRIALASRSYGARRTSTASRDGRWRAARFASRFAQTATLDLIDFAAVPGGRVVGRTYSPKQRREFTDANRRAWEETAPIHEKINQARLLEAFAEPGYNTLDDHCLDRLREIGIEGKTIAQLCCNNGRELLSLKNLGAARCVGFDASAAFIEQARELAEAAGHTDVEFVTTDIYEIPPSHAGPYDIVLTTVGVISWMPDLQGFFEVFGRLTKPGGHIFIEEIHPVLMMYEEGEGDDPSYLKYSYFKDDPWVETGGLDYYEGTEYESNPHYSFQHTLADIAMAAIEAGFALKHFAELGHNIAEMCADLERAETRPPMGMTMVWQKN
jgi:SAM-dependent methyltransferase